MAAVDDPDLELVRALQAGQESALGELIQRHEGGIFRFCYRSVLDAEDAADFTQETFVRAYFKIGQFRPGAKFSVWLYRIALNLLRDHARSRAAGVAERTVTLVENGARTDRHEGGTEATATTLDPAGTLVDKEERLAVEAAIQELPADLKEAFILTVLEGHSQRESGEMLGASPKAVETRVYRARKLLAAKLRAIWP